MVTQLYGRKLGMTQIYRDDGTCRPVTVLEAGPCTVIQVKTKENDGYTALQIAYGKSRKKIRATKAETGHVKKAGLELPTRTLGEIPWDGKEEFKPGDKISVAIFETMKKVDVTGYSKGRGWTGTIKRWNFRRQPATHGMSDRERAPGSLGRQHSISQGVPPGKRMGGRWGNEQATSRNLDIAHIDKDKNLLFVTGGVPGPNGGTVLIKQARWVAPKVSTVVSKKKAPTKK